MRHHSTAAHVLVREGKYAEQGYLFALRPPTPGRVAVREWPLP